MAAAPASALAARLGSARLLAIVAFGVAAAQATFVVRPFHVFAIGYDAASSVLYFDRIVAGLRLEAFLGTTPKPLQTILWGAAHAAFGDWRVIAWLAIVLYGLAIAAAAVLARTASGSLAAGVFVAAGLTSSSLVLQDVSLAYAVSPALLALAMAGLSVLANRPRYGLAGLSLAAAALFRPEAMFVTAGGLAVLAFMAVRQRLTGGPAVPRAAWLLAGGLVAVPLIGIHDWLLTGDAAYSLHVSSVGASLRAVAPAATALRQIGQHFAGLLPLIALATVGAFRFWRRRAWAVLVGLAALAGGVIAFEIVLSLSGLIFLPRYLLPADAALIVAGGAGIAELGEIVVGRLARRERVALPEHMARREPDLARSPAGLAAGAAAAAALAIAVSGPIGLLDHTLRTQIVKERAAVAAFEALRPAVATALASAPGATDRPLVAVPLERPIDEVRLAVPARLWSIAAVDLAMPLNRITATQPARFSADGTYPVTGWLVYLDARLDVPAGASIPFRVTSATAAGSLYLQPVAATPAKKPQAWLIRVAAAQ